MPIWLLDEWLRFILFFFRMFIRGVIDWETIASVVWVVISKMNSLVEEVAIIIVLFGVGLSSCK